MTTHRYPQTVGQAVGAPVARGVSTLAWRMIRRAYRVTWGIGLALAAWYLGAWPRVLARPVRRRPPLRGRRARQHRQRRAERIAFARAHAQTDHQEASRRVRRPRHP